MTPFKGTQSGFSIISLMISSAIGIFLIGGAIKVYIDSKSTFNARSAIAAATENYRFAFQDMRRTLVMAGRGISPEDDDSVAYAAESDNGQRTFPSVAANESAPEIASNGIVDIDANGSSVIAVRYAVGPSPCGMSGQVSSTVTARFYVDSDGNLHCQVPETGGIDEPLVSGIDRMRALYGVDTDGDGIANQYLTATAVTAASRWVNVVAIRIGIIAGSGQGRELPAVFRPTSAVEMNLLGETYTPSETNFAYKSAETVISLRNLHQSMNRQAADYEG